MKPVLVSILLLLLASSAAFAVITFTQLDDDIFVISHRIKVVGSRGRAMKLVYEKAASLCVAAGYAHFAILDQESAAAQEYEAANASVRVQFYDEDAEGRMGCEQNASAEYVAQAHEKLARQGYRRPEPAPEAERPSSTKQGTRSCTVDQITAMVKAGLSDEQIKAACPEDSE
jgi:hypothetical protein